MKHLEAVGRASERASERAARMQSLRERARVIRAIPPQPRPARALPVSARDEVALAALRTVAPPDWSGVPKGDRFCRPNGPRCSDAKDYTKTRRPCCVAINREVLRFTADLLNTLGVCWWADYGTLLGAVRHGGMIPWDKDNDLGILENDALKLVKLEKEIRRLGFGIRARWKATIKIMASSKNETNCDVFQWRIDGGKVMRRAYAGVDRYKGKDFPESRLFPLTTVMYDGLTLPAPAGVRHAATPVPDAFECFDPEVKAQGSWFLEHRYGKPAQSKTPWWVPVRANNDRVIRR